MPAKAKKRSRRSRQATMKKTRHVPSHDAIRRRAYEIYEQRQGAPGKPEDDWKRAEHELAHTK